MRPQPLIAVRDVQKSSRWYQRLLDCKSGHGGPSYEVLMSGKDVLLQLHAWGDPRNEHEHLGDPATKPYGNGVLLWFQDRRLRRGGRASARARRGDPGGAAREPEREAPRDLAARSRRLRGRPRGSARRRVTSIASARGADAARVTARARRDGAGHARDRGALDRGRGAAARIARDPLRERPGLALVARARCVRRGRRSRRLRLRHRALDRRHLGQRVDAGRSAAASCTRSACTT